MSPSNSNGCTDCCAGVADATPRPVSNAPGLAAIGYRIGAQADFKAAMLDALSRADAGPLRALQTREDDDFTIALLDGWATALDVLTFYQERLANEAWLGTATERGSVVELARLTGYEPRPGLAAEAALVFTLEDAAGAPASVTLDPGVSVQSVPGPGEQPVTFETVESLELRPAWNTIRPQPFDPIVSLDPYGLTYWVATATPGVKPGDLLLILAKTVYADKSVRYFRGFKRITTVTSDYAANRTRLDVEEMLEPQWSGTGEDQDAIIVLGVKSAPFGHNAPLFNPATALPPPKGTTAQTDWNLPADAGDKEIWLDRDIDGIPLHAALAVFWPYTNLPWDFYRVNPVATVTKADFSMSARVAQLEIENPPKSWLVQNATFSTWRGLTFYVGTRQLPLAGLPASTLVMGNFTILDRDYFVHDLDRNEFEPDKSYFPSAFQPGRRWVVRGQTDTGADGAEVVTVASVETDASGSTRLDFTGSLVGRYLPQTVTLTPNVVRATHGETVGEILGSGNGGQPWQQFTLRQAPLTYLGEGVAAGGTSTLEIQANGLLWSEVPSFYEAGPNDRVYTTSTDKNGSTVVRFGDGRTGARLPSGVNNVQAIYRKGSGAAGNVRAGQLTLLGSRPAGVRAVTNPLPAAGGVDPEPREDARQDVPMTALTLDRIVSLQDYADYARAFAGIARSDASADAGRVLLSVVGPGGAALLPNDPTVLRLAGALRLLGDPTVPFQIVGGRLMPVVLNVTLRLAPDVVRADVLAAARGALLARFGFDGREFGDLLAETDFIATLQGTPGVVDATITKFTAPDLEMSGTAIWPDDRDDHGRLLPAFIAWLDESQLLLTVP